MGYLKDLSSEVISPPFPQAQFELTGEVPASQCSEAKIEGDHGITTANESYLVDPNKFIGFTLDDKICHILSPPQNANDYTIAWNLDDRLILLSRPPFTSSDNIYYISDGGSLILTRNIASFAAFIHTAGYAYTIKGGKLYTDIPSEKLQPACTILFDPLS